LSLRVVEKIRSFAYKSDLPILLAMLDPKKDDVILDVGAGTGWIASNVAERCDEVYALEPVEKRVEHIKRRHPEVKAFSSLANSIPFPPNYFDKLYAVSSFHHFSDQEDALEEFRRVLKKGGLLLVNDSDGERFESSLERKILGKKVKFVASDRLDPMAKAHEFETLDVKKTKRGFFALYRNAKTSEHGSNWLGEDVRDQKSMRFS
jgi:ubiquinone/menaquinone biosynthesis C-methylase UbiE